EWLEFSPTGLIRIAKDWCGDKAQPAAATVPRGFPLDPSRNADGPRPRTDPADSGAAVAGGIETIVAQARPPDRAKSGQGGRTVMMRRLGAVITSCLTAFLIGGVRFYQTCLRPLLPAACRFYPICS